MEALRQEAISAAIDAYRSVRRIGDPNEQACRAALRAYLRHGPDDANASDEVVKAIASTNIDQATEPRRVCRRLQTLRSWSHDKDIDMLFT
jgi:hypothetical protein